jgi:hypothetical protein
MENYDIVAIPKNGFLIDLLIIIGFHYES